MRRWAAVWGGFPPSERFPARCQHPQPRPTLGVGQAINLAELGPLPFEATARRRPRAVPRDSFRKVLDCWPSLAELAKDINEPYHAVYAWWRSNSVPRWHFPALLKSAEKQGI